MQFDRPNQGAMRQTRRFLVLYGVRRLTVVMFRRAL